MNTDDDINPSVLLRARITIPSYIVYRSFDSETVLLNLQTGSYHGLNPTGGRVLEHLRETGSVRAAAEAVSAEDHHPVDDVLHDLVELCAGLAERGLIEIHDAALC